MSTKKLLLALCFVQGLILTFTPFVLYPVCSDFAADGARMKCFHSGMFITLTSILILICIALSYLGRLPNIMLAAASILAFMCWFVPHNFIGLCGTPEHSCRAVAMPHVGIFAAVIIVLSVSCMIFGFIGGKDR